MTSPALTNPSAWERLWPLLVTAALSLLVLAVVQLAIVPRLEVRKRREERWEADLLALGEFLTFEYRQALDEYSRAVRFGAMLFEADHPGGLRSEHLDEGWSRYHELRRAAADPYDRACSRLDWLADRVVSLDAIHPTLWRIKGGCFRANSALQQVDPRFRVEADTLAAPGEVDAASAAARSEIVDMVTLVKELVGRKPPIPPSRPRRYLRDRWRVWRRNRRKIAAEEGDTQG